MNDKKTALKRTQDLAHYVGRLQAHRPRAHSARSQAAMAAWKKENDQQ